LRGTWSETEKKKGSSRPKKGKEGDFHGEIDTRRALREEEDLRVKAEFPKKEGDHL